MKKTPSKVGYFSKIAEIFSGAKSARCAHIAQNSHNVSNKVENILKGSLDGIPSLSPSVKIQIMGGKVCLRCKGKTLLVVVNK